MAQKDRLPRYERPEMPFERGVSPLVKAGRFAGAGLEFGLAVVLFFLGGRALDAYWGTTEPWMTVVGALVGVAVGTWLLIRPLLRDVRDETGSGDRPRREPPSDPGPPTA